MSLTALLTNATNGSDLLHTLRKSIMNKILISSEVLSQNLPSNRRAVVIIQGSKAVFAAMDVCNCFSVHA